jgi:hypothetical protein
MGSVPQHVGYLLSPIFFNLPYSGVATVGDEMPKINEMPKIIIETPDGEQHELSPELGKMVEDLAKREGLSLEHALQQALANEQVLQSLQSKGAQLLYTDDDGQIRELVRRPLAAV